MNYLQHQEQQLHQHQTTVERTKKKNSTEKHTTHVQNASI